MRRPTAPQKAFAAKLDLDIPAGATQGQVSKLLDHELKSRNEDGYEGFAKGVTDLVRKNGIRVGSVLLDEKGQKIVLHSISPGPSFRALTVQGKVHPTALAKRDGGGFVLAVTVLYNPPITHENVWCVRAQGGKPYESVRLRQFIASRIDPNEVIENDHGTFWAKDAVGRLTEMYLAEVERRANEKKIAQKRAADPEAAAAEKERKKRERALHRSQLVATSYCIVCGADFIRTGGKILWYCPEHQSAKLLPDNGFCNHCKTPIAKGKDGAVAHLCSTCSKARGYL